MKVYFIGICGVMMAPLAVAMSRIGHDVRGSDKGFYPPISTYLYDNKITLDVGFREEHITDDIDLAVFGAAVTPTNPEVEKVLKLGIKHYAGYGQFLSDFFREDQNIVVAGTYGKTTTTAFIAHALVVAGYDPTFAFGGLPINYPDGVRKGSGGLSVFEGDEYINARNDRKPRFLYYNPTQLVLTSASYDHLDVYPTEEDYKQAFSDLVAKTPEGAIIIASQSGENLKEILKPFKYTREILWVNTKIDATNGSDGLLTERKADEKNFFTILYHKDILEFETDLIGKYIIEDITLGVVFLLKFGINIEKLQEAVRTFKGVRRRLEIKKKIPYYVIEDLAHNSIKAQSTINSLKEEFPDKRLIVVFEPHTLSSRMRSSLYQYKNGFKGADIVYIAPVYHPGTVKEEERITSMDISGVIGKHAEGFIDYNSLNEKITNEVKEGDVLVFMTSGTIGGLIEKFAG